MVGMDWSSQEWMGEGFGEMCSKCEKRAQNEKAMVTANQ
jgi:hypothetical protein